MKKYLFQIFFGLQPNIKSSEIINLARKSEAHSKILLKRTIEKAATSIIYFVLTLTSFFYLIYHANFYT